MIPEPMPPLHKTTPLPGTPPAPPNNIARALCSQIVDVLAGYAYSHTSLPCAELCTLDSYTQDSQHNADFDPDILTDEGTSTG